jgi:hypothetical protein
MRLLILFVFLTLSINVFAQNSKLNDSSFKLTNEVRSKLISASKNNGKLDYWSPIKGHELEGERIEPDYYVSKEYAAIIKWTYAVAIYGVRDKTAIISLYEDLKKRKINNDELIYIDYGYKKALKSKYLANE